MPSDYEPAGLEREILQSGRSAENAVRQAEDAFGFSVGRESLGLYSSSNVRGFSPLDAGNVRIEGLYFDPFLNRSEEHTSELQSLMRISYAVFCLKKKNKTHTT